MWRRRRRRRRRLSNIMDSITNSSSTLFSSVLFLSPVIPTATDNVLSHLNFLFLFFMTSILLIFTTTIFKSKPMLLPPGPAPWPLVGIMAHLLLKWWLQYCQRWRLQLSKMEASNCQKFGHQPSIFSSLLGSLILATSLLFLL